MNQTIQIDGKTDALLIVDVQNDFCTGGNLAVPAAENIVPDVNRVSKLFTNVILTQDWHPTGHTSFASVHQDRNPLETIELEYGTQVLWPDHCIAGTPGAEFHPDLETAGARMVIRKGTNSAIDSYSAFFENDRKTPTGLTGYLKTIGVKRVFVCGIVAEFCVGYSCLDGRAEGFEIIVLQDATAKFGGEDFEKMSQSLADAGAKFMQTGDLTT